MFDDKILKVATKLVGFLGKSEDEKLPKEIVYVVKHHSKMVLGSALIPVPGADVASGVVIIQRMYAKINKKIGLSAKENFIKKIGSGVQKKLVSYMAVSGVASAMKFIPGVGSIGGAVIMSASLFTITMVSGYVYLQALCKLAEKNGPDINIDEIGAATIEILSDKDTIKNMITKVKNCYKK